MKKPWLESFFCIGYFAPFLVIKEFRSVTYLQGGLVEDVIIYLLRILSYILVTVYRFQTTLSQIFPLLMFFSLWRLNWVVIFSGSTFVAVRVEAAFTVSSVGEISMLSILLWGAVLCAAFHVETVNDDTICKTHFKDCFGLLCFPTYSVINIFSASLVCRRIKSWRQII